MNIQRCTPHACYGHQCRGLGLTFFLALFLLAKVSELAAQATCQPSETTLCLSEDRFALSAVWTTPAGLSGTAHAVKLTADSGYFWFFTPTNIELLVKIIEGCTLNGSYWFFAGGLTNVSVVTTVTDTVTGNVRIYTNPQGTAFQPIQDTSAFPACTASTGNAGIFRSEMIRRSAEATATPCSDGATLCLGDGRFLVRAQWTTPDARTGRGTAVALTSDTGYFWFFGPENIEVIVKVLKSCSSSRAWVFGAGLTNVQVELSVEDRQTGVVRTYHSAQGRVFAPIQDTNAFVLPECLPSCLEKGIGAADIERAVIDAVEGFPDPLGDDFANVLTNIELNLGCRLLERQVPTSLNLNTGDLPSTDVSAPGFDLGAVGSPGEAQKHAKRQGANDRGTWTCDLMYCPTTQYCGPGTSQDKPFLDAILITEILNRVCFDHDACYRHSCVPGACPFVGGGNSSVCDAAMLKYCSNVSFGLSNDDFLVCTIARAITLLPRGVWPSECFQPLCSEAECEPRSGKCGKESIIYKITSSPPETFPIHTSLVILQSDCPLGGFICQVVDSPGQVTFTRPGHLGTSSTLDTEGIFAKCGDTWLNGSGNHVFDGNYHAERSWSANNGVLVEEEVGYSSNGNVFTTTSVYHIATGVQEFSFKYVDRFYDDTFTYTDDQNVQRTCRCQRKFSGGGVGTRTLPVAEEPGASFCRDSSFETPSGQ